jgi:hypothetical protein
LVELGEHALAALLASTQQALRQRSGLVIITPDVEGGWLDSVALLLRRGVVPTVLLLDQQAFGGRGDASRTVALLESMDVSHYLISPELLDQPEARPGQVGQWRKTSRGQWEPQFHPRELVWRALT